MMERQTLEKFRSDHGQSTAGKFACDHCKRSFAAFALVDISDIPALKSKWACGDCIADNDRAQVAASEAAARVPKSSWASEYGAFLKAERNRLLDASRWTIMPDTPLSSTCQAAFTGYLRALQRMTVDCATTDAWHWPALPALDYPPIVVTATATIKKS